MSKDDEGEGVGGAYRSQTLVGRGSRATQRSARAGNSAILCVVRRTARRLVRRSSMLLQILRSSCLRSLSRHP